MNQSAITESNGSGSFEYEGEQGKFSFKIADARTPLWYGPHKSGGRLAIFRAAIFDGTPKSPIQVYIYILWTEDSEENVIENFIGYKMYSSYMNADAMFQDLTQVIEAQVVKSTTEYMQLYKSNHGSIQLQ